MPKTTTRILLLTGLLAALAVMATGCKDASANGRCADLPQPGDPVASPDEPGRVPCALRPPPLR